MAKFFTIISGVWRWCCLPIIFFVASWHSFGRAEEWVGLVYLALGFVAYLFSAKKAQQGRRRLYFLLLLVISMSGLLPAVNMNTQWTGLHWFIYLIIAIVLFICYFAGWFVAWIIVNIITLGKPKLNPLI